MEVTSQDADLGQEPETNSVKQVIYIGPNIPGGALHRYQVLLGEGLPEHIKALPEECPEISGLFVPVESFATAEIAVMQAGTAENTLYRAVVEHYQKGGK